METAHVIVDQKGSPKKIFVKFEVKTDFVVQEVRLFYKSPPTSRFKNAKLKLTQELLYSAELPPHERIDYYIGVKSERGDETYIGSREEPFLLVKEILPSITKMKKRSRILVGAVVIVAGIIAAILAALALEPNDEKGKLK